MSEEVFSVIEITGVFNEASKIFIYNAMDDEVATMPLIERWMDKKEFYLPVIESGEMVLRKLDKSTKFEKSKLGILEPKGEDFTDLSKLDLIIVPGVAYDRLSNRLGRGGGYYDRFLSQIKAPKMGICFDFQLVDNVPTEPWDVKMNLIVSENELIW